MMSLMASFCAVLFPLDVLDEIWDLTESVSEGFLTYSNRQNRYISYVAVINNSREPSIQCLALFGDF